MLSLLFHALQIYGIHGWAGEPWYILLHCLWHITFKQLSASLLLPLQSFSELGPVSGYTFALHSVLCLHVSELGVHVTISVTLIAPCNLNVSYQKESDTHLVLVLQLCLAAFGFQLTFTCTS